MNETLKTIADRRSIRAYTDAALTEAQIETLIRAAQESPSARNAQLWHFAFCRNPALLSEMNAVINAAYGRSGDVFYAAPLVIFISAADASAYAGVDSGIAVQTIALAAHSMGLGSVILGMPRAAFKSDRRAEFEQALQIPEGYHFEIAISVGVPAATKDAHEILPGRISRID